MRSATVYCTNMTPSVRICFIEEFYLKTEPLKTALSEELNVVWHQQNRLPGNL
jgi:hypothetical protein